MKKLFFLFLFLSLALFPLPSGGSRAADLNHFWPMYMTTPQHTGRSPFPGPVSSQLKWVFPVGDFQGNEWVNPSIAADGTIFLPSSDGIYALRPDGTLKWKYSLPSNLKMGFFSCPSIDSEGKIIFGTQRRMGPSKPWLIALNPDGTLAWFFETGGDIVGPPTIWEEFILFGSQDGNCYRLNLNGQLLSYVPTGGEIGHSSPSVAPDGTYYFSSEDGFLYAVHPNQGVKWKFFIDSRDNPLSTSIDTNGIIYCLGYSKLFALNPDGTEKWSLSVNSSHPPAIGPDGTLYLGGLNNVFYSLNPINGSVKWRFRTGDQIYSAPAIDANGNIYFGSRDHKLYALRPDGSLLWSFETGEAVDGSPAIGPEGTLYVFSDDGTFYAFGTPQQPSLELLQPRGGESILLDGAYEIKWQTHNPPQGMYLIRVEVSLNDGPFQVIAEGQDTGSVSWTPPITGSAIIRISLLSPEGEVLCQTQSHPIFFGVSEGIFSDVLGDYWAFHEIKSLVYEGIVKGYPDGTFRPDNPVTRAEFAKMILLTCDYAPEYPDNPTFPDVPMEEWFYPYVEGAFKHGLVVGYPNGSFKPQGDITIAEVLTVIVRAGYFPLKDPSLKILVPEGDTFRFINSGDWFFRYVGAAEENGIICFPDYPQITIPGPGAGENFIVKFNHQATRAQTSVFLARLISYRMMGE